MARQLQRLGYRVHEAPDGAEALETFRRKPEVDILVTDVLMPGPINGPALLREIRKTNPQIRAIVIGGEDANLSGAKDALRPGDVHLRKPFAIDDLAAALRRATADASRPH